MNFVINDIYKSVLIAVKLLFLPTLHCDGILTCLTFARLSQRLKVSTAYITFLEFVFYFCLVNDTDPKDHTSSLLLFLDFSCYSTATTLLFPAYLSLLFSCLLTSSVFESHFQSLLLTVIPVFISRENSWSFIIQTLIVVASVIFPEHFK